MHHMTSKSWLLLTTAILIGTVLGIGAFTFVYARGASYMTNDPAACANCHIMNEHYGAWLKSSHHTVAVCNDCHAPHTLLGKYATKARNGFWHSFYFTTGNFPDPLRITPRNLQVTEHACRYCHAAITEAIDHGAAVQGSGARPIRCTGCHRYVGHEVR
jgi:cytochrome c nitrite reductase small subunit